MQRASAYALLCVLLLVPQLRSAAGQESSSVNSVDNGHTVVIGPGKCKEVLTITFSPELTSTQFATVMITPHGGASSFMAPPVTGFKDKFELPFFDTPIGNMIDVDIVVKIFSTVDDEEITDCTNCEQTVSFTCDLSVEDIIDILNGNDFTAGSTNQELLDFFLDASNLPPGSTPAVADTFYDAFCNLAPPRTFDNLSQAEKLAMIDAIKTFLIKLHSVSPTQTLPNIDAPPFPCPGGIEGLANLIAGLTECVDGAQILVDVTNEILEDIFRRGQTALKAEHLVVLTKLFCEVQNAILRCPPDDSHKIWMTSVATHDRFRVCYELFDAADECVGLLPIPSNGATITELTGFNDRADVIVGFGFRAVSFPDAPFNLGKNFQDAVAFSFFTRADDGTPSGLNLNQANSHVQFPPQAAANRVCYLEQADGTYPTSTPSETGTGRPSMQCDSVASSSLPGATSCNRRYATWGPVGTATGSPLTPRAPTPGEVQATTPVSGGSEDDDHSAVAIGVGVGVGVGGCILCCIIAAVLYFLFFKKGGAAAPVVLAKGPVVYQPVPVETGFIAPASSPIVGYPGYGPVYV